MAKLNMDFYDGNNYYSDGNIEDVILGIVENKQNLWDFVGTDNFYPIIYHLSSERENILNWYPFKKKDTVLEVGAGCGAITGLLCRACGEVTSVELSERRSRINYARNKEYDNLEIIVGNLNEIHLNKRYDYVVLTGVFEYALSFTAQENPYVVFLKNIKDHLNDNGKILLSIENRLGIKYFGGAPEDHTNGWFDGLEQYEGNDTVRTFSKNELEDIFEQCGISKWKFFYPYPDYKFPTEIFSDENVNKSNYGRIYRNYQADRVSFFDEFKMVRTLKNEGIMGSFSNSFMVELCMGDAQNCEVLYAKMNNTRKPAYRIATIISKVEESLKVKKVALCAEAKGHVASLFANQSEPLPDLFEYLKGEIEENAIIYSYVDGENMDEVLNSLLYQKKKNEIKEKINIIYGSLMKNSSVVKNIYASEFVERFGDAVIVAEFDCIKDSNIDMIFDNLYWRDEKYLVIDPEWVMDFWVPVKFILWRMLNEWYSKDSYVNTILPKAELMSEYGISEEMECCFTEWAVYFATHYVSERDMDTGAALIKKIDVRRALELYDSENCFVSSLYIDTGEGYIEKDKYIIKGRLKDKRFFLRVALDNTKLIKSMRWDPIENQCCRCVVYKCQLDGKATRIEPINAEISDNSLFLTEDSQMKIQVDENYYSILEISGEFEYLNDTFFCALLEEERQNRYLCQENVKRIETEKEDLNREIRNLQRNVKQIETEKQDLNRRMKNLQRYNAELETGQKIIVAEKDVLAKEVIQLVKQNKELNNKNTGLLTAKNELVSEIESIKNQLDLLQTQIQQKNMEIAELRRRKWIKKIQKLWEKNQNV